MNFIMLPPQTLRDSDAPPLRLSQNPQSARVIGTEERLWYEFEQRLRQDDMAIFEFIIGIFIRVVYPATGI